MESVQAVIRYGITPVAGVSTFPEFQSQESYVLGLRFRIGQGSITAKLIQLDVLTGTESVLIEWASDILVQEGGEGAREMWQYSTFPQAPYEGPPVDFVRNAYYVELTLSAKVHIGGVLRSPPAVSVIQWLNPKAKGQLGR
jgi:hypothetical protein